jgi:YidC/Oxa1 family membrane protein insertase
MDKRTLLAVVLSTVIIIAGMVLQPLLFPAKTGTETVAPARTTTTPAQQPAVTSGQQTTTTAQAVVPAGTARGVVAPTPESAPPASQPETITRETDLYTLTFNSAGGTLASVKLNKYRNLDGSLVDMELLPKSGTTGELPFALSFGTYQAAQVDAAFTLKESTDSQKSTFDFSRTFYSTTGVPFTLHKTYVFNRSDYLFQLDITIANSVNEFPGLDFGGYAYTLSLGPQIGPTYAKLDGRNDSRAFAYWENNKHQDPRVGMGQLKELDKQVTWAAIVGKYFTAIAVPGAVPYHIVFDSRKLVEGFDRSTIHFERPVVKSALNTDTFYFYMGPMKKEILGKYNDAAKNPYQRAGLHADEVVTSSPLIGWLAVIFKYLLDFSYRLIPNYGVAIILLTLFLKIIFFPLTFKSTESMARMSALNPKMEEIRKRLKEKPEKMNQEIAELYKKEKVNPLSGCLPLLLQIPVFFALYNLLNSHFELRGAMFIPGWITDLSVPESILDFGFTIPLVGWSALRVLPIVMVISQILSSKLTQPTGGSPGQSGAQAKMLMYLLPIVFFFMLYDMPSGLNVYWTVQNFLSIAQQLYMNWLKKKKDAGAPPPPTPLKVVGKIAGKGGGKPAFRPVK